MKRIAFALLSLFLSAEAQAQTKFTMPPPAGVFLIGLQVVSSCGAAAGLIAGNTAFAAMDTTGNLCTNATGGGGGGGNAVTMASGAVASGAYASGSIGSGAMVDLGTIADPAATAGSTGSLSAKLRLMTTLLDAINTGIGSAIPTGGNSIGSVGSDPSKGPGAPSSVAINVSTATTTQLVAINASTAIYVTSYDVIAGGTGNITFVYGTGSSCGTGTTSLTGAYPLTAQAGIAKGAGVGTLLKVPAGNALCVTTSAAVQMSGSVSYQQF